MLHVIYLQFDKKYLLSERVTIEVKKTSNGVPFLRFDRDSKFVLILFQDEFMELARRVLDVDAVLQRQGVATFPLSLRGRVSVGVHVFKGKTYVSLNKMPKLTGYVAMLNFIGNEYVVFRHVFGS